MKAGQRGRIFCSGVFNCGDFCNGVARNFSQLSRLVCCLVLSLALQSQAAPSYPPLNLVREDPAFQFIQASVQGYYRSELGSAALPDLALFSLEVPEDADLLGIASRTGLLAESISTLNGLRYSTQELPAKLVVPNIPGVFLAHDANDDLSSLLRARLKLLPDSGLELVVNLSSGSEAGTFYPGQRLNSSERLLFLQRYFAPPLRAYRISASFGLGKDPFDTGLRNHQGIDLVPTGSDFGVRASAPGTVRSIGENSIFGKHVIIRHDSIFSTLYAHLSKVQISAGQAVHTGTLLGQVGNTGLSTGPHLHFELHRNGFPVDPATYITVLR